MPCEAGQANQTRNDNNEPSAGTVKGHTDMVSAFSPAALCNTAQRAADIFTCRIRGRNTGIGPDGYPVRFDIVADMDADTFTIADCAGGAEVTAGGLLGLLHGAGFFLRMTEFFESAAEPCRWRGTQNPTCAIRGVYFASHFHNFYHTAPMDEIGRYIEDLALWGFNYIKAIFPMIDIKNENDPECAVQMNRLNQIFGIVHSLGMKAATTLVVNSGYVEFPPEYLFTPHKDPTGRRGNSGNMMCPSIPGANELIMRYNREFLEGLRDNPPDMVFTWPYDEGGCACDMCYPWGGNGFIKYSKQTFEIARAVKPDVIRCVSTWCFDTPCEGEWAALADSLREEQWCDCILADAHEDFPRYPLENPSPGGLPVINFPEISMWGLSPWGGWGATALPERFTRLWGQASRILSGGFVYSEGIYEDINKAVVSQLYWHGETDWRETLRQYARYELGITDAADFIELIALLETAQSSVAAQGSCDTALSDRAFEIARVLDAKIPVWAKKAWRWRILYLRALLDARRYRAARELNTQTSWAELKWKELLKDNDAVQAAFREIIAIFHCMEKDVGDPYHSRVRPRCE